MPQASRFEHLGATLRAEPLTEGVGPIRLIYLHGWGQGRDSMRPLASALSNTAESWVLDLPGFGEAPLPPHAYAPADYATLVVAWLATLPACPTYIVGHSFGFRVAVHMAMQAPAAVAGIVSLAGAGVPKTHTFKELLRRRAIRTMITAAKRLKPFIGSGVQQALRDRFGSRDYLAAGEALRPTFLATVNDNLTSLCPHISQPVLLIYGEDDTETPPSIARKFKNLFPSAKLVFFPHHNHYSILQGGRPLVEKHLRVFLAEQPKS